MGVSQDPRSALVHRFFSGTGPTYDCIVNALTFGIDRRWKRTIVERIPEDSRCIVDLACGTGISTLAVARRFPQARVIGVELREEYLELARRKVAESELSNIEFVLCRAEDFRGAAECDCVVSSYLAKYADLPVLIEVTKKMLRKGGLVLMHDFTFPPKGYLVAVFRLYFWVLQKLGTFFFPAWREIFYGLPLLIERTRWLDELPRVLKDQGFHDIETKHLTLYGSALVIARK